MNTDKAIWHVAYALAWLIHWPIIALGGVGIGATVLAGFLARGVTKGLRLAQARAYPERKQ